MDSPQVIAESHSATPDLHSTSLQPEWRETFSPSMVLIGCLESHVNPEPIIVIKVIWDSNAQSWDQKWDSPTHCMVDHGKGVVSSKGRDGLCGQRETLHAHCSVPEFKDGSPIKSCQAK